MIVCAVVDPGFHKYEEAGLEVSTTLSPLQNVSGPEGVMTGVAGVVPKTAFTGAETLEQPLG